MYLKYGRDLATVNMVGIRLYRFLYINRFGAVDIYAWDTIVVARVINIYFLGDITNEGVDGPSIFHINDKR